MTELKEEKNAGGNFFRCNALLGQAADALTAHGHHQLADAVEEAERGIDRLVDENRALRIAQKACETCGPNTARWEDGEPANLEAAAEDAHEWLAYLQARSKVLRMENLQWDKLDRCIKALRAFVRPNAQVKRPVALEPLLDDSKHSKER